MIAMTSDGDVANGFCSSADTPSITDPEHLSDTKSSNTHNDTVKPAFTIVHIVPFRFSNRNRHGFFTTVGHVSFPSVLSTPECNKCKRQRVGKLRRSA